MHRRLLFVPVAALSAAVLLAACGGSTPTTGPTGAATVPAGATSAPVPTTAVTAPPVGGSIALPTIPSFAPDTDLAGKFPKTIDGQPVTDVQTLLFAQLMASAKPEVLQNITAALSSVGIDFNTLSFGTGQANVDGEDIQLQALRTPGTDASKIIQNYALISTAFGNAPDTLPTMTQGNVGGKNVTISTGSDETVTVLYVNGDTLWIVEDGTDSQNNKIFSALP